MISKLFSRKLLFAYLSGKRKPTPGSNLPPGPFGVRSGQFRTKIFGAKNLKLKKVRCMWPSPPWRGPSSRRLEHCRPEGPRRGGDGPTNYNFWRKFFKNYGRNGILRSQYYGECIIRVVHEDPRTQYRSNGFSQFRVFKVLHNACQVFRNLSMISFGQAKNTY